MLLDHEFFARPTLEVAPQVLGLSLNRRMPDGDIYSGIIVEVEAYTSDDPACHAFKGKTPRTEVMFGEPGFAYVYLIYGMYHCLNIVTERFGVAGAILIRAVDGFNTNGPGKLCKSWQITKEFNGVTLLNSSSKLWISKPLDYSYNPKLIEITDRIGIKLACDKAWRFFIKDNPSVSKPKK